MFKKLFAFLVISLLFLGCAKETHVQIPAYIQIDSYYTKVTAAQGTNNQNFSDMLVDANGQSYGTYPLGSKIPVLTSGPTSFVIRGVIEVNGVNFLRADYELMKGCDTLISVTPGKVTHIVPVFEYFSTAQFRWLEDFDGNNGCSGTNCGGLSATYSGHPEMVATYTPGFGGTGKCLALRPNDTAGVAASVRTGSSTSTTTTTISLPAGGVGVYVEFNYQGNVGIEVYIEGLSGVSNVGVVQDCGGVFASAEWKKTYIDLTEQVSSTQSTTGYIIYFTAFPSGGTNDQALIDNIKIITAQ